MAYTPIQSSHSHHCEPEWLCQSPHGSSHQRPASYCQTFHPTISNPHREHVYISWVIHCTATSALVCDTLRMEHLSKQYLWCWITHSNNLRMSTSTTALLDSSHSFRELVPVVSSHPCQFPDQGMTISTVTTISNIFRFIILHNFTYNPNEMPNMYSISPKYVDSGKFGRVWIARTVFIACVTNCNTTIPLYNKIKYAIIVQVAMSWIEQWLWNYHAITTYVHIGLHLM